jgi:hypothetical protein
MSGQKNNQREFGVRRGGKANAKPRTLSVHADGKPSFTYTRRKELSDSFTLVVVGAGTTSSLTFHRPIGAVPTPAGTVQGELWTVTPSEQIPDLIERIPDPYMHVDAKLRAGDVQKSFVDAGLMSNAFDKYTLGDNILTPEEYKAELTKLTAPSTAARAEAAEINRLNSEWNGEHSKKKPRPTNIAPKKGRLPPVVQLTDETASAILKQYKGAKAAMKTAGWPPPSNWADCDDRSQLVGRIRSFKDYFGRRSDEARKRVPHQTLGGTQHNMSQGYHPAFTGLSSHAVKDMVTGMLLGALEELGPVYSRFPTPAASAAGLGNLQPTQQRGAAGRGKRGGRGR